MGGKAEKGTPKYIANKIKAKGLQKLRWYCQMCQKQCRDENGFKCHTMSESHQRQLLLFADNANKYIDDFSKEFADGYLELLRRQFGTKRVNANKVYQDYISNRDHLHMNATQWETLTDFVKWLGREGKCVVDETEKGWFVAYIDRDPAAVAAMEAKAKKEKMDKDDQERMLEFIQKQVERGKQQSTKNDQPSYSEFKRESSQERVTLSLNLKRKPDDKKQEPLQSVSFKLKSKDKDRDDTMSVSSKKSRTEEAKTKSALDEVMEMEERAKERANRIRSTKAQIQYLRKYMHGNPEFAAGYFKTAQGASQHWMRLKAALDERGPSRTIEQWKVAWRDQKRKARAQNAALDTSTATTCDDDEPIPDTSENCHEMVEIEVDIGPEESPVDAWRDQRRKACESGALKSETDNVLIPDISISENAFEIRTMSSDMARPLPTLTIGPDESSIGSSDQSGTQTPIENVSESPIAAVVAPTRRSVRIRRSRPVNRLVNAQMELNSLVKLLVQEVRRSNRIQEDRNRIEEERNAIMRKDYWLTEGIVVKIVTKSLGDKFYKKKGTIESVIDKYGAQVKLTDEKVKLKLDQNHLETVIPSQGRQVRFVNGAYRGLVGTLKDVDTDNYCCQVEISEGPLTGRLVKKVQYEDICKIAS